MSSIDPTTPPPTTPSTTTPPVTSDTLHNKVTVTGNDLIDSGAAPTINDYMIVTQTAYSNSKDILQDVERQQAESAEEQGRALGLEASSYAKLLSALHLNFASNSVDATALSAPTANVNSTGAALNTAASSPSTANAVNTYNQAVTTFDAAQATFNASAQSPTDITTYNDAVNAFNSAAATYNAATTHLNAAANSYNIAVSDYNAEITTANAQIAAENINRAAEGRPLLTPRTALTPATTLSSSPALSTYPPGNTTLPTAAALPAPVDSQLVDYSNTSFSNVLAASGLITAADAYKQFVKHTTKFQNYTTKDLTAKHQKQQKNIAEPDAYITPKGHGTTSAGGDGSTALASAANTGGSAPIQAVLSEIQVKHLLKNLNIRSSVGVEQSIQALAATHFSNNIPSTTDLNQLSPDESTVVSALATLTGAVAQSQSGTINTSVTSFVQNAEEFKNLNEGDKKLLANSLTAAIKVATLTLGAAGLANQVGGSATLNPAFAEAKIQANPTLASQQFSQAQAAFDEANQTFGAENVAATAGKLVTEELIKAGVISQTAFNIGTSTGNAIVQNGIGSNPQDLVALVQTAAQNANSGQALPDNQAQQLARSLLLLGLGSSFQTNAEGSLIQQLPPETASQLAEQSAIRLFGFSANFSQATINRREDEPKEELSFSRTHHPSSNTSTNRRSKSN